jgi:hypothetical protein
MVHLQIVRRMGGKRSFFRASVKWRRFGPGRVNFRERTGHTIG